METFPELHKDSGAIEKFINNARWALSYEEMDGDIVERLISLGASKDEAFLYLVAAKNLL